MSDDELLAFIEECIELGVTSFDHADIYGNYQCELLFGRVLGRKSSLRAKIQLITKCGIKLTSAQRPEHWIKHYDVTARHIVASVEQSLRNFQTDHIDLLLLHRPDPLMDADEVATAFSRLRESGKVREFGVSNFNPQQFNLLHSRFKLVTNQIQLSLMHTKPISDGTLDTLQRERVSPSAWSPFAGGHIFKDESERATRVRQRLEDTARKHAATSDQIALSWLLRHPSKIFPVVGTGNIDRMRRYVGALDIDLSRQDWFSLLESAKGNAVP